MRLPTPLRAALAKVKRGLDLPSRLRFVELRLDRLRDELATMWRQTRAQLPQRFASSDERLSDLRDQLRALQSSVASIERSVQQTQVTLDELLERQRALLMRERVDVVEHRGFILFMFKDDLLYTAIPQQHRHQAAALVGRRPRPNQRSPVADVQQYIRRCDPASAPTDRLLAHLVKICDKLTIIDVGCQYGISAMSMARFVNSLGGRSQVFAFDCGLAGELAPHNIALNGYEEQVRFYPFAVSSHDGFVRMTWKPGHSEDNHIARPMPGDPLFSRPVRAITLDRFAAETGIGGPVFVKIDTQGVEDAVLHGMQNLLHRQVAAGIVEFTPWTYRNRGVDLGFISDLMRTHLLFDIGAFEHGFQHQRAKRRTLRRLAPDQLQGFARAVDESAPRWTDLMFLPRTMPQLDELLRVFGAAAADAADGRATAA